MESLSRGLNLGLIGVLNKGLKEGIKVGVIKRIIGSLIRGLTENLIRGLIIDLTESPIGGISRSLNPGATDFPSLDGRYIQIMWKIERGVIFDYNKRRVPPKSAPAKGDTP